MVHEQQRDVSGCINLLLAQPDQRLVAEHVHRRARPNVLAQVVAVRIQLGAREVDTGTDEQGARAANSIQAGVTYIVETHRNSHRARGDISWTT